MHTIKEEAKEGGRRRSSSMRLPGLSKLEELSKESCISFCVHWLAQLNRHFSPFFLFSFIFLSLIPTLDTRVPGEASAGSRDDNVKNHLKRAWGGGGNGYLLYNFLIKCHINTHQENSPITVKQCSYEDQCYNVF